jgi:hypothetical protein
MATATAARRVIEPRILAESAARTLAAEAVKPEFFGF